MRSIDRCRLVNWGRSADAVADLRPRVEEPRRIDDIVERSGLNSSELLATLFDLEMKGDRRAVAGQAVP